jgi:hypothetical protein
VSLSRSRSSLAVVLVVRSPSSFTCWVRVVSGAWWGGYVPDPCPPPHAWAVVGTYTAKTAVVVSPPRRGVFLGSANSGCPAKTAVVLTPPRRVVSLAFASSEDGGGVCTASLCGFPRVRKPRVSSEDGGGVHAASAGLRLLWLGLFKVVQAATTAAVGFSPRRFCLS